mmetsp:Transcript_81684/g.229124  ORF Transcript_81684/g.229124 Transcript_81684/m.229124 type:complete len:90 (-) Transcript_81684:312-581(-)
MRECATRHLCCTTAAPAASHTSGGGFTGLPVVALTHRPPSAPAPGVQAPPNHAHSASQSSSPHMRLQQTGGPYAAQPPRESFEAGPMQQ